MHFKARYKPFIILSTNLLNAYKTRLKRKLKHIKAISVCILILIHIDLY